MVLALPMDVPLQRSQIGRPHGFGPVAGLPMEGLREQVRVVEVVGACALQALHEIGERNDGRQAEQRMHVVGSAACGEQDATELTSLASEQASEPIVERAHEQGTAVRSGPDDVNENKGRRAAGHTCASARRTCSRLLDAETWKPLGAVERNCFMSQVRMNEPFRGQGVMRFEIPDDALADDHRARLLWRVVETLDLTPFTAGAKSVAGHAGRPLASVRMLLVLWLYGISVGVGSARAIERLTGVDDAFRWIVGDQAVSHARLSQFRIGHGDALDRLFTDVLGVLLQKGLLSLDLVAQDGTRIRANATAPSFRGETSLEACREQATLHVHAVLAEAGDLEPTPAENAARLAAARDYQRRVEEALVTVKQLRDEGKEEPRASTTDAEARVMKMPDGGYRPGFNVQMATAGSEMGGPRTIVGVIVTNVGSDMGSVTPMLEQIKERTGTLPKVLLADANHAKHDCIRRCAVLGVKALISVPSRSAKAGPNADTDAAVREWRDRMETDEAKRTFRARASLCELSNAHLKHHHGVAQVLVRGLDKVSCVALLAGLAANLLQHATKLLA